MSVIRPDVLLRTQPHLLSIGAIGVLTAAAGSMLSDLQQPLPTGLHTGRCACGRTISENKARCKRCANEG